MRVEVFRDLSDPFGSTQPDDGNRDNRSQDPHYQLRQRRFGSIYSREYAHKVGGVRGIGLQRNHACRALNAHVNPMKSMCSANHAHMIYDSLILSDATPQRKNITQNGKSAHFVSYV